MLGIASDSDYRFRFLSAGMAGLSVVLVGCVVLCVLSGCRMFQTTFGLYLPFSLCQTWDINDKTGQVVFPACPVCFRNVLVFWFLAVICFPFAFPVFRSRSGGLPSGCAPSREC